MGKEEIEKSLGELQKEYNQECALMGHTLAREAVAQEDLEQIEKEKKERLNVMKVISRKAKNLIAQMPKDEPAQSGEEANVTTTQSTQTVNTIN